MSGHAQTVHERRRGCVARFVALAGRGGPSAGADDDTDARSWVELRSSRLHPWRARFEYLKYVDDETGLTEYHRLAGWAKPPRIPIRAANSNRVQAGLADGFHLDKQAEFERLRDYYWRIAVLLLNFQREDAQRVMADAYRNEPEQTTKDALAAQDPEVLLDALAEEYLLRGGRRGTRAELAHMFYVDESTIHRRLDKCEKTGRLAPGTLKRR